MGYMVVGIKKTKEDIKLCDTLDEANNFIAEIKEEEAKSVVKLHDDFYIRPQNYIVVERFVDIPVKYSEFLQCGHTVYANGEYDETILGCFETKEEAFAYIKQNKACLKPSIAIGRIWNNLKECWLCSDIDGDRLLFYWEANEFNNTIVKVTKAEIWDEIDGEDKQ